MSDPNATYKRAFAELTEKLGRVPTPGDSEWLRIGNEYSRSWGPAEEILVKPKPRVIDSEGPTILLSDGTSRVPAWGPGSEAVSGSRINPEPPEAESSPPAPPPPSRPSERARAASPLDTYGRRGPNGGVIAECVACGRAWERPARRGRPSFKCGECK